MSTNWRDMLETLNHRAEEQHRLNQEQAQERTKQLLTQKGITSWDEIDWLASSAKDSEVGFSYQLPPEQTNYGTWKVSFWLQGESVKLFSVTDVDSLEGWFEADGTIPSELDEFLEDCMADASQYETPSDWKRGSLALWDYARRKGWSEQCHAHMESGFKRMSRCVRCVDTGQVFDSISDAAEAMGRPRTHGSKIGAVCRGKRQSAFSYHWEYVEAKD